MLKKDIQFHSYVVLKHDFHCYINISNFNNYFWRKLRHVFNKCWQNAERSTSSMSKWHGLLKHVKDKTSKKRKITHQLESSNRLKDIQKYQCPTIILLYNHLRQKNKIKCRIHFEEDSRGTDLSPYRPCEFF